MAFIKTINNDNFRCKESKEELVRSINMGKIWISVTATVQIQSVGSGGCRIAYNEYYLNASNIISISD